MQKRDALRDRLQVQRPVERGIAAADDEHILVAELLHLAHRVEDAVAFIGLDARHRRPLRLERAAAGGDDHDLALEHLAAVGLDPEERLAELLDALDHLVEMECRVERLDLLHQVSMRPCPVTTGSPECRRSAFPDRVRRTGRRACQNVDEVRFDIEEAQLEHGEQAARARRR